MNSKSENLFLETGTKEAIDGYCAWFRIDNQTFHLATVDTEEEAKWYLGCLNTAFDKIPPHILRDSESALRSAGVFRREDLNPEFLKTIDGIEENLKRKDK